MHGCTRTAHDTETPLDDLLRSALVWTGQVLVVLQRDSVGRGMHRANLELSHPRSIECVILLVWVSRME